MSLQTFLTYVSRKGVNKIFIYYKEKGKLKHICYQDRIFFLIDNSNSVRFINPLRAIDTLDRIRRRELKFVGLGHYVLKVDLHKGNNRKVERRTWRLS